MNNVEVRGKTLIAVSGIVLLSVISLIAIILSSLFIKSLQEIALAAAIVMVVLILLHVWILFVFLKAIRINSRGGKADDGLNNAMGLVLLFFGVVILDGAIASLDNKSFVSILMFLSVFCDIVAGIATVLTMYLLRKHKN